MLSDNSMKSLDRIYELATSLFCKDDWPDILTSLQQCLPEHSQAIWDTHGDVIAFVIVTRGSKLNCANIAFCGVNPCHQGKGYGSKLLKEALISIFRPRCSPASEHLADLSAYHDDKQMQVDFTSCQLIVDGWNHDARRLYERLGFQCIAPYKVAHTDGFVMELLRGDFKKN